MQHPDLTYASATSLQAARRAAADARRKARAARSTTRDEELPAQLLVGWLHLAGLRGVVPILELRGVPVGGPDELATAPASGDAA